MNGSELLKSIAEPGGSPGSSLGTVLQALNESAKNQDVSTNQTEENKVFKIKSNSLRNRTETFGDLTLHFDASGVASVPESNRHFIERLMVLRPGRFSLVEKPAVVEPEEVKPAAEESKVDSDTIAATLQAALEDEETEEAPKKASPAKKATKKRITKKKADKTPSDSKE